MKSPMNANSPSCQGDCQQGRRTCTDPARCAGLPPVRDLAGTTDLTTDAAQGNAHAPGCVRVSVRYFAFNIARNLSPAAARTLAAQLLIRADQAEGKAA